MATAEQRNHAKSFLKQSAEYLESAEANLIAERYTPAAGDAIHAGISAKDAIVTALTGATARARITRWQPKSCDRCWRSGRRPRRPSGRYEI
jgi:hypothetical protein